MKGPRILIAFGGNALVERGEDATQREQLRRADALARTLAGIVADGAGLVLVHGNGPQVGDALIRVESSVISVPPLTLDVCVAESQGSIGFLLEKALRNALRRRRKAPEPVTVLTPVRVRSSDPALRRPSKPIGPYYPRYRARELRRRLGWRMIHEEGRGYRRVVPSPRPVEILGLDAVEVLLEGGRIVIAAGGGGIPVVRTRAGLQGVEAVIDKDHTSALLARRLGIDVFLILTDFDGVYQYFGKDSEKLLSRLPVSRVRRGLARGEFPAGSMGPKVEAAADFARRTGREVLITSPWRLADGLKRRAGTRVTAEG